MSGSRDGASDSGRGTTALVVEPDPENRIASENEIAGIVIGRVVACRTGDRLVVDYDQNPTGVPLPALGAVSRGSIPVGQEVALTFEGGNPERPIVLGPIRRPSKVEPKEPQQIQQFEGELDGRTLTFTAEHQIVLRCGKASVTLTRAGKILIRGAYLLNRSSGVNRIKGGSVQIN